MKATACLPDPQVLARMGEFFAAGYFEQPEASPMLRWLRAVRRRLERRAPVEYKGGLLYPCGPSAPGGHRGKPPHTVAATAHRPGTGNRSSRGRRRRRR
jgi:hypothetical protein